MNALRANGLRLAAGLLLAAAAGLGPFAPAARGDEADGGARESDAWRKSLVLTSPVMDYAGVLPPERKAALEAAIAAGTASNGAQLVVASLPSLKGGEIGDFAVKLFEQWRIGEKGQDNGVLLLLALEERQVDIEVGYGFEGALPDAVCGRIRDEAIVPRCREGDYAAALEDGAAALLRVMAGETFAERKGSKAAVWIFWAVFAGFVVLIIWSARKGGGSGEGSSAEGTVAPVRSSHRSSGSSRHGRSGGVHRGGALRGGGFHGHGGRSGGGGARGGW